MTIGLSTYAYLWRSSDRVEKPLTLHDILEHTRASGCSLLQICDFAPLDELTVDELNGFACAAADLGIQLELGTRGVGPDHLSRYLEMATHLGVTLVRSMLNTATERPSEAEAIESLRRVVPHYAERGVTLALETYEQVPVAQLVRIIEAVDSEALGVCLDPGNCVAALELPRDVVTATLPYVKNWHVKDFAFTRQAGWVGFNLVGCPLGEGLLEYDSIAKAVDPATNNINQIVEHWLPWQHDAETTCAMEDQWTQPIHQPPSQSSAREARWANGFRIISPRATTACSTPRIHPTARSTSAGWGARSPKRTRPPRKATSSSWPSPTSCWARFQPTSFPP
jgi:sugar phosphate isomerase/epimerase